MVTGESKIYNSLNLIGGLGIVIESLANSTYPPAALNLVWSVVAIYAIFKAFKGKS